MIIMVGDIVIAVQQYIFLSIIHSCGFTAITNNHN